MSDECRLLGGVAGAQLPQPERGRGTLFPSQSSVLFQGEPTEEKRDKKQRQISTRVDDGSVGMQSVKHNLASDAKEIRQRGKMKLQEGAEGRRYGPSNLYRVPTLW